MILYLLMHKIEIYSFSVDHASFFNSGYFVANAVLHVVCFVMSDLGVSTNYMYILIHFLDSWGHTVVHVLCFLFGEGLVGGIVYMG